MTSEEHSKTLNKVIENYEQYEIIAVDEGYPGIFDDPVPDHKLKGKIDLLLSNSDSNKIKVIEAGSVSSPDPGSIERKYLDNAEQLQKHIKYFESIGYDVDPSIELRPRGKLGAIKRIWEDTTGVFTWNQARDIIDNDDVLSQFKNDEVIVFDSLSKTGSELYSVNEEKDEYKELIDLFYKGVI